MADVNANIGIHIDSSAALAELKALQRQLATFHASIAKNSAAAGAAQKGLQQNLLNAINATGQFHAQMGLVRTSTESFTHALENNKLSMREYFRYAGASTKSFGRLFKEEFNTIGKVAEERVRKMQTQYIKMGRDASGAMKAMSVTPATLNMNDYATKAAVAAQKQALFNQLIKQGSTSLLNFGKNTQWAGRQLMVGFSVPLMYIGSIASKTFMEMEEQAIRFKRVYGDIFTSAEETDKAIKDIELLAKSFTKYGVAVTDTMKMAADAAAMGKTGAELTAQVAEATRLAVLGGVEQQQSLETTISLTNAFGISADQLASKINFLNAVENQTVVSIEDLTIAIPKAGPVIKQLGGDVEDLAFFLTAMKEGGINASEGANALKSGLASLINPSKKAAAMLMDLGVNINGIVEANAGDVKNTVIGFAQALDTLDPLNRSRAIEQLFGKFQFARLSTLFQNITKDGTQASKVLGLTQASVEELAIMSERELKRVEDAVGVNFKQAVEDLKVSIMPIGKAFLEALTPIVKFAAELLKKFDGLGDGTKKFIVVATTLVGILGPTLLMTFGLVANGAANIIKLFLALRTGFLKLSGNTTVLSQQTSYLNAEQLEAATVAASLNQAHTRLTQSFTLETTAVNALRNAYVQATTAALTFARANPGMMAPGFSAKVPKKFAKGSTYVPGKGTKDTVPSMLTPGEAVIPRDVAQNPAYQPIIDAMVNGKLQGFSTGTTAVVAFGAHQPFTTAHEDIANQGKALAVAEGSEFIQYTSAGTKAKKGVVSLGTRVRQIEESVGKPPVVATDPFAVMEDLKNRGITEVKVLLGSDRMESTVFDLAAEKHGITLQKVEVPRKPGSQDDVSATKLREAVESGDLKTARKLLAKGTSAATKKLIIDEIKDHYKTEKSKVTLFDREYNAKTPGGAEGVKDLIKQFVPGEKADTYVFTDPKTKEQTTLTREKIIKAFDKRSQPGDDFTSTRIQKALNIGTGVHGAGKSSAKKGAISDLAREAGYPNKIEEQEAIEKYLKERGIKLDPGQKKSFFQLEKAHIVESKDAEGNKIFRAANIVPDSGWSNNYLNTVKGAIGQDLLAMTDDQLKARGTDRASVERLVSGEHPNTAAMAKAMRAAAVLDVEKNPTKAIAHAAIAGMDYRFETGFYPAIGSRPTIAELFPDDPTVKAEKAEDAIFEATDKNVKDSKFKDEPVTRLGKRTQPTTGWSFKEANHIGGIYTNPDGSRVFIKPMMTEDIALAEQRLTEIGRRTGLQTPEQTLRVIQDPRTGKKLFALESPYSETFDPATIPTTFGEDDYFKQLVGAGVRGDTDLKKGNLGGSVLTDVGRAGVLNKASGLRYLTMDIPSIKEIAEKNLSGVTGDYAGNSPRWFGNATADIAKNMTPDVYQEKMLAEINRQEGIIRQALIDFNLNPQERPYYENMLRRLEEAKGVNWRELHKLHTSIVIKPDEEIEKIKTGETRKPQTKSKPGYVKSSSKDPNDTKIIPKIGEDERVVQGKKTSKKKSSSQKSPRGKIIRPGFSDAGISQSETLANFGLKPNTSGMKIEMPPAGLSDAEFKKQFDALNKAANNTTGRFKDLANKSNVAAGAISGLTMMAAFSGGKLGEVATAAMPFVFGIQGIVALLPLMKNPWVAAVSAVAAVGLGLIMTADNAKKMAKKQVEYIDSISATTNKMKKIGEVTDTFGASEIMATRRADSTPTFSNKPVTREGQQFGTNFMGSEVGKEISKGFSDSLLTNRSTAVKQFALQLSSYVSDGVIDGVQAGDVARQIATDFQDMSLYPAILGQLTSIIGPDGVDILKDPIEVRIKIINEEAATSALAADQIIPNMQDDRSATAKIFENPISSTKRFFTDIKDQFAGSDRSNKAAAAAAASSNQLVSSAKAQADATQIQYEKDLDVLKAKKAIAKTEKDRVTVQKEIDTLTDKNKKDNISLREETAKALAAQQAAFSKTSKRNQKLNFYNTNPAQTAFIEAGREQVKAKFKDTGLAPAADAMLAQSKDLKSKNLEVRINAIAQTGTNPMFLSGLMTMFKGDEDTLNKQIDLAVKTRGIDESVAVINQLAFVEGEDLKKEFFVGINAITNETEYGNVLKTLSELSAADGKDFDVTAVFKAEGVGGLIRLSKELAKIEAIPGTITKIAQIENSGLPPESIAAISSEWAYFMSLPETVRKEAITSYLTVYEYAGSGIESGNTGVGADAKYDQEQERKKAAAAALKARYKPGMNPPAPPPPPDPLDPNGNAKGRDTTLDELMKKLKFVRDAAIDAEGNIDSLVKVVSGKGITKFTGVSQQLLTGLGKGGKGGFNREFIDMLESMDNKTRDIYMTEKKGVVTLTAKGKALKEAYNEKTIGVYHDAQVRVVQDSVAQQAAFVKLKAAGVDSATALKMTANAADAVAINSSTVDSKKIEELAAVTKAAADDALLLARALEEVASAANLDRTAATEKLNTLEQAKNVFKYSNEDLKSIADSPALLEAVKNMLSADKLGPEFAKLKEKVEKTLSDNKYTIEVEAKVNILTSSIQQIASSVQSIFDGIASNIQKIIQFTANKVAAKWDPIIADADAAADAIQATIDDDIIVDPVTGKITGVVKGLQTQFDEANDAVNNATKTYDKSVEDINKKFETETSDFTKEIERLNKAIRVIKDAKDINVTTKTSIAEGFGDNKEGIDTNALSLADAEKFVADTQVRIQEIFNRPIEEAQQKIAGYAREIETKYTRAVEEIQKKIEGFQRKIAVDIDIPLKNMQDESSRLSEDLAVMDKITESINDKYKVQEDALTKVAELNQDIVEQQKQQLGLADALSKGDISAAAAAAQEMRATQAAKSLGAQQGTLGKAKEAELDAVKSSSGLTRDQIAARQYEIERASYAIQIQRAKIEKEIADEQEKIYQIETNPNRLATLKLIKDEEDRIYALELSRQTVNNGLYAIQTQIEAKNTAIAAQQAAITTQEDKIQVAQDAREASLKTAQEAHATAMVGLNADLTAAETKLKDAQIALAKAQAEADALRKAKEKEITSATEAMKAEFKLIEDGLIAAEAAALDFTKQIDLAKAAAVELVRTFAGLQKDKDDAAAKDIKRIAAVKQAEIDAANSLAAADSMRAIDAENKAKADEAEAARLNDLYSDSFEMTKQQIEELKRVTELARVSRAEANRLTRIAAASKAAALAISTVVPSVIPPVVTVGATGPNGTYAEGLAKNPQLKGMNPETIAAILKGMGYYNYGGLIPKIFAEGGFSKGTDTVPAMLTPGEFVVRKAAVDKYGMKMLSALNEGYLHKGGPVGHKHKSGAPASPYTTNNGIPIQTLGGSGPNKDKAAPKGFKAIFNKEAWEQTANFFGLPSIGKTLQDLMKYGGPSPLAPLNMTIARLMGKDMKSTVGDNALAALNLIPIPIAKLAKPVVNAAAKTIPQGVKKFVEKDLGIDMFSKLSAKLNGPAPISVAAGAPEVPVVSDVPAAKPKLPDGYSLNVDTSDPYLNFINVTKDGEKIGQLSWDKITNSVEGIKVLAPHQGQGIATEMWNYAKTISPITHSPYRTPAGDRFAHSIGDEVVPLNEGWLPGDWSQGLLDAAKARAANKPTEISVANTAPEVPVVSDVPAAPVITAASANKPAFNTLIKNLTPEQKKIYENTLKTLRTYSDDIDANVAIDKALEAGVPEELLGKALIKHWKDGYYHITSLDKYEPLIQSLATKESGTFFRGTGVSDKAYYQEKLGTLPPEMSGRIHQILTTLKGTERDEALSKLLGEPFEMRTSSWTTNESIASDFAKNTKAQAVTKKNVVPFTVKTSVQDEDVIPVHSIFKDKYLHDGVPEAESMFGGKFKITGINSKGMTIEKVADAAPELPISSTPMLSSDTLSSLSPDTLNSIGIYKASVDKYNADIANIKAGKYLSPVTKEPVTGQAATNLIETFENLKLKNLSDIEIAIKNDVPPGILSALREYTVYPVSAQYSNKDILQQISSIRPIGEDQVVYRGLSDKDMSQIVGYKLVPNKNLSMGKEWLDANNQPALQEASWSHFASDWKEDITEAYAKANAETPIDASDYRQTEEFKDFFTGINIGESWVPDVVKSTTDSLDWAKKIAVTDYTGGGNAGAVAKIFVDKDVLGFSNLMNFGMGGTIQDLTAKEQLIAPFTEYVLKEINPLAHRIEASGNMTASKLIDEYVFEAKRTLPVPYVRMSDQIEYPTTGAKPNILSNLANNDIPPSPANTSNMTIPPIGPLTNLPNLFNNDDTPVPPKIIKSTISAGKLKQLQKLLDEDTFMTANGKLMMASGGLVPGLGNKDTISSMLTPGEFVIKKSAVDAYGANNLAKINDGTSTDSSVYNYSLSVNVSGNNLNADDIASTVMQKIKYIDGQRIRGQR